MLGIAARKRPRSTTDARGRRVPLASGAEVTEFLRTFERRAEHAAGVRELTPDWRRRLGWTTLATWAVAGCALAGHTVSDIIAVAYAEELFGAIAVFAIATAIVLTQALIVTGIGGAARIEALAMRAVGVCPSCLYRLDGAPAAEDGCVVCPECGGSWRGVGEDVDSGGESPQNGGA